MSYGNMLACLVSSLPFSKLCSKSTLKTAQAKLTNKRTKALFPACFARVPAFRALHSTELSKYAQCRNANGQQQ